MEHSSILQEIHAALPGVEIRENEPLSRHCSFRIGGPARAVLLPGSAQELSELCGFLKQKGQNPLLLGNGTNVLFPDRGLDRLVIRTCRNVGAISVSGTRLTAECGATLASAAAAARDAGLTGLEFAHGIPGSVGGGVIMNAGAYGGELKDIVAETVFLDENMETRVLRGTEHGFSYRNSALSGRGRVVLQSVFALAPGDPAQITEKMQALMDKRRASQPLDLPSAGSTFKRPAGGFAAALIDEAGLKGFSIGGAQVSEKHAGFVVNIGGASCEDVLRLMEHIQKTVLARSGIELEPEVRIIRE